MEIYHASNFRVERPALIPQNHYLDFGYGFYTTFNYAQALEFAVKVAKRQRAGVPTINVYAVNEERLWRECTQLKFNEPNAAWLDFVCANRTNTYTGQHYDLIYGPVANDKV